MAFFVPFMAQWRLLLLACSTAFPMRPCCQPLCTLASLPVLQVQRPLLCHGDWLSVGRRWWPGRGQMFITEYFLFICHSYLLIFWYKIWNGDISACNTCHIQHTLDMILPWCWYFHSCRWHHISILYFVLISSGVGIRQQCLTTINQSSSNIKSVYLFKQPGQRGTAVINLWANL